MPRSEFTTRLLSALLLGGAVLGLTYWSFWAFAALCAAGTVILIAEWRGLTRGRGIVWAIGGMLYIASAMAGLVGLRHFGAEPVFVLFALVWGGDTAAYLVGKRFGRHKIIPRISPGKSWEGLLGAMLACVSIPIFFPNHWHFNQPLWEIPIAASFAVVGLLGDLFESSLKRHAGQKDSGTLIPGHGGLLDRVDALMACVLYAWILRLMGA